MIRYGQFCPVAKTAEIFGDRWSPLIIRELCYGPRSFGDFLAALPLALYPSIAQIERAAGFRRDDTNERRLDKLEAVLARGTNDLSEAVPALTQINRHQHQGGTVGQGHQQRP